MLQIAHLSKTYPIKNAEAVHVLHDIDLTVNRQSITAVIGASGSGKSTLSKCVSLLERPTQGRIIVDGLDFTALSEQELRLQRRKIGTIFQASSLLSRRTVAQNIALPLQYLGVTTPAINRRVMELLENVGLSDRAHHYPGQLSGGQQQRVGIARALALKPKILLADEATSGLDPETTHSILSLINRLKDELSLSVMLITHEMDVVRQVADQVAVLSKGEIIEQGQLHELILNPSSAIGKQLLPLQRPQKVPADFNLIEVTYRSAVETEHAWLSQLSQHFSQDFIVLAANVEAIAGQLLGRVLLAFRDVRLEAVLAKLNEWQFSSTVLQDEAVMARFATTENIAAVVH